MDRTPEARIDATIARILNTDAASAPSDTAADRADENRLAAFYLAYVAPRMMDEAEAYHAAA